MGAALAWPPLVSAERILAEMASRAGGRERPRRTLSQGGQGAMGPSGTVQVGQAGDMLAGLARPNLFPGDELRRPWMLPPQPAGCGRRTSCASWARPGVPRHALAAAGPGCRPGSAFSPPGGRGACVTPWWGHAAGAWAALVLAAVCRPGPPVVAVIPQPIASLWLTGAFHEDGLADTFDALGGTGSRAKALEIMKDSRSALAAAPR